MSRKNWYRKGLRTCGFTKYTSELVFFHVIGWMFRNGQE